MTYSINWWISHLNSVSKTPDGYMALCPAHDDRKQSLSLKLDKEEVLVHCFAGCKFEDILHAIEDPSEPTTPKVKVTRTSKPMTEDALRSWWVEYTGVPIEEWESWGVQFAKSKVYFTWPGVSSVKTRRYNSKEFGWEGSGPKPPLWPMVPEILPEVVWLTEGESDLGVLKHLGFTAFSITKGAGAEIPREVWESLFTRGARTIVLAFDQDAPGQLGAQKAIETSVKTDLEVIQVSISTLLNPLNGEKDIRDIYKRLGEPFRVGLQDLLDHAIKSKPISRYIDLESFVAQEIPETAWLVKDTWLAESTGMISGPPKSGKSWLALDFGLSVATGKPFLGEFPVECIGPVAFVTSEDPDPLLQDRLHKILISKGLGGRTDLPQVAFPRSRRTPFYLDLSREFTFSESGSASLLSWLEQIYLYHGSLALVIFDPVLRFLPPGIDEYKASEVSSAVFQITSQIYKRFKSAVVLVHHKSKGGADGKGSYGSVAFGAFSESALYLTPSGEGIEDWVNVLGEYKSAPMTHWAYRFRDLQNRYAVELDTGVIIKKVRSKDLTESTWNVLIDNPQGVSVQDIIQAIPDSSDYLIRLALKGLESREVAYHERAESSGPGKGPRPDLWFPRES
jgi:hypothetical protein